MEAFAETAEELVLADKKRAREDAEEDAEAKRARVGDDDESVENSENESAGSNDDDEEEEAGGDEEEEAGSEDGTAKGSISESEEEEELTPEEKKAAKKAKDLDKKFNNADKIPLIFADEDSVSSVDNYSIITPDVKRAAGMLNSASGKRHSMPFTGVLNLSAGATVRGADLVEDAAVTVCSSEALPERPALPKEMSKEERAHLKREYVRELMARTRIVPCEHGRGALCIPVNVGVRLKFKKGGDITPMLAGKTLDVGHQAKAYYVLARCTESRFSKQYNEAPCRNCKPYFFSFTDFFGSAMSDKAASQAVAAMAIATVSV